MVGVLKKHFLVEETFSVQGVVCKYLTTHVTKRGRDGERGERDREMKTEDWVHFPHCFILFKDIEWHKSDYSSRHGCPCMGITVEPKETSQ